jgi:hypothetical protein
VLGVTSGVGAGGGATGATGFGRAIGLFIGDAGFTDDAVFVDDAPPADLGGDFFGAAFFGAAFFAFFATFALLAFLAGRLCFFFFLAMLFLAEARFAFAAVRFFPLALAFFFAMVSHLLAVHRAACESSPEKVCCHLA